MHSSTTITGRCLSQRTAQLARQEEARAVQAGGRYVHHRHQRACGVDGTGHTLSSGAIRTRKPIRAQRNPWRLQLPRGKWQAPTRAMACSPPGPAPWSRSTLVGALGAVSPASHRAAARPRPRSLAVPLLLPCPAGSSGTGVAYSIGDAEPVKRHHSYPDAPRADVKMLTAILYQNR